jgi:hypothetical protein
VEADVLKIAVALSSSLAILGIGAGVSQAATVPRGTPPRAVVVERNESDQIRNFKLRYAGPMTGRFGYLPLGDGGLYAIHWTRVSRNRVRGTGRYIWGRMGSYRSGPVTILLTGSHYRYTRITVTLTRSWYGVTRGNYPPYGHGAHYTSRNIRLAVRDSTTNLIRY